MYEYLNKSQVKQEVADTHSTQGLEQGVQVKLSRKKVGLHAVQSVNEVHDSQAAGHE